MTAGANACLFGAQVLTERPKGLPVADRRPRAAGRAMKLQRSLGTLALVFVLFFCTSGGPFTIETLVVAVGPGLALRGARRGADPLVAAGDADHRRAGEHAARGGGLLQVGAARLRALLGLPERVARRGCTRSWTWRSTRCCSTSTSRTSCRGSTRRRRGRRVGRSRCAVIWTATAVNLRGARPVGRVSVARGDVHHPGVRRAHARRAAAHDARARGSPSRRAGRGRSAPSAWASRSRSGTTAAGTTRARCRGRSGMRRGPIRARWRSGCRW